MSEQAKTTTFNVGDSVRVLVGVFAGKTGTVGSIAEDVPKFIGVPVPGSGTGLVWFKPDEIEKLGG